MNTRERITGSFMIFVFYSLDSIHRKNFFEMQGSLRGNTSKRVVLREMGLFPEAEVLMGANTGIPRSPKSGYLGHA
jgi:hypothetical protein